MQLLKKQDAKAPLKVMYNIFDINAAIGWKTCLIANMSSNYMFQL